MAIIAHQIAEEFDAGESAIQIIEDVGEYPLVIPIDLDCRTDQQRLDFFSVQLQPGSQSIERQIGFVGGRLTTDALFVLLFLGGQAAELCNLRLVCTVARHIAQQLADLLVGHTHAGQIGAFQAGCGFRLASDGDLQCPLDRPHLQ